MKMSDKKFNSELKEVGKTEESLRDRVENLARAAIEKYSSNGDTSRIANLVNDSLNWRSIRGNTLKEYIKFHANVVFKEKKEGAGFTVKKNKADDSIEATIPEGDSRWYNFDNVGIAKEKIALKILKGAISSITKANDDGNLKTMTSAEEKMVARLKADIEALAA
tara:strand:- start:152 stop:646 length:495 start_codon:yes stop_codon:yes gene_type:complete